jgi:hypothetical protein
MWWQKFLFAAAGVSNGGNKKQEQRQRIQKMPDEVRSHPMPENDPVSAELLIERAECKGYQER